MRKFGAHLGLLIKCPVCGDVPPIKQWEREDFIAYGYRKWKWLCNHLVSAHARKAALTHRRIVAEEARLQAARNPKKRHTGRVIGIKHKKKAAAA